jgi:formamidopyrimidine-DNA glycosylase
MPELPEVQTIVNDMHSARLCGLRIVAARVFWPRTIATGSADAFRRRIQGRTIEHIDRRAKYIVFALSGGFFWLVHLRMTGRFQIESSGEGNYQHVRAVIDLNDRRSLLFYDTRKFGRFYLTCTPDSILGSLGPEPLAPDFSAKMLADRIDRRRGLLKPLLLNQQFISGLGNIYVDEALWAARIHPTRTADTLSAHEVKSLHRAIRHVLRQGVRNAGTTLGSGLNNYTSISRSRGSNAAHLKVFRRTGMPCPRCGDTIVRIIVAQRSTHLCAQCQRAD